jgi:diguanylate cyclase (GGDEF)-like protein
MYTYYVIYFMATTFFIPILIVQGVILRFNDDINLVATCNLTIALLPYFALNAASIYTIGRGGAFDTAFYLHIVADAVLAGAIPFIVPYIFTLYRVPKRTRHHLWRSVWVVPAVGVVSTVLELIAPEVALIAATGRIIAFTLALIVIIIVSFRGQVRRNVPYVARFARYGLIIVTIVLTVEMWSRRGYHAERHHFEGIPFLPILMIVIIVALAIRSVFIVVASTDRARARAMEIAEEESQLQILAVTDQLTGFGNRKAALRAIAEATTTIRTLQLVDIDLFRIVTSAYGRSKGDLVLKEIAKRMSQIAEGSARVFRVGADRFALLWHDRESARSRGGGLRETITAPYNSVAPPVRLTASICETDIEPKASVNDAITRIAIVLEDAKSRRNTTRRYTESAGERFARRRTIFKSLSTYDPSQFHIVWEPIVDRGGTTVAAEALIRWHHDELGTIPPSEFIPAAEACGAIDLITNFVVDAISRELNSSPPAAYLHINIPSQSLVSGSFDAVRRRLLTLAQAAGVTFTLEFPERTFSLLGERVSPVVAALVEDGFGILIDGFGTGSTVLTRLTSINATGIKLGEEFVGNIDVDGRLRAITDGIITGARNAGMHVYATRVSHERTRERLLTMGIDFIQGQVVDG